jgi:hypothetical protein
MFPFLDIKIPVRRFILTVSAKFGCFYSFFYENFKKTSAMRNTVAILSRRIALPESMIAVFEEKIPGFRSITPEVREVWMI